SLLGAAAGLGLAQLALRAFDKALSTRLSLPEHLSPNWIVLGALLVLSILSALLFGLLPAWLASSTPIEHALRQSAAQTAGSVRAAALSTVLPLRHSFSVHMTFHIGQQRIDAGLRAAGPELQQVLDFRMYEGRYFDSSDTPDSPPVAVVNRAFARLYSPDRS